MLPEIGNFALILALLFAGLQALSAFGHKPVYRALNFTAVFGQFTFLLCAFVSLIFCFIMNDMTVVYVQEHSHALLPILYRVGATWGGHEGSLLLWCVILSGWSALFALSTKYYQQESPYTLGILGLVSCGFIAFLFFTSNPFMRVFPFAPIVGDDLTPVLQDPGLIFHPPMLYLGYVGFALPFAFAINALLQGKMDANWARACRPWVILPWSFLSAGIALGSWWAYRELGWGGWWFWDPVENASLLPWLSATALIHSLIVSEKKGAFQGWTILLAIITFTLSLLGTFLVRSGVLVSVHAFANDPTRGLFLLAYLAFIICSALLLYSIRIKKFYRAPEFSLLSRETFLLINTIILLTAVATITLGTLYPIILEALNLEKISVGEPYFNTIFVPLFLILLASMSIAPHVNWQNESTSSVINKSFPAFILSALLTLLIPPLFTLKFYWLTSVGIWFALWLICSSLQYVYQLLRAHKKLSLRFWSMLIAHIAIAIIVLGVTINKSYKQESQVKIKLGETVQFAGYTISLKNLYQENDANFKSISAVFAVAKEGRIALPLVAEQRIYRSHQQDLSHPGIVSNPWRDIYIALGNSFADGSWTIRIYYEPLVRWIWAGAFLLLLGGFISLLNHIRRPR